MDIRDAHRNLRRSVDPDFVVARRSARRVIAINRILHLDKTSHQKQAQRLCRSAPQPPRQIIGVNPTINRGHPLEQGGQPTIKNKAGHRTQITVTGLYYGLSNNKSQSNSKKSLPKRYFSSRKIIKNERI